MEENKSKLNKDIVVSENIEKSKHGYLIFYCRLCKFSLIIIPLTYMYAQFQVWKYQLMLNGVTNKRWSCEDRARRLLFRNPKVC